MEHINWYPGHMKKTRELIQENLKLVDAVLEVIDARIPRSSRNPIIDELVNGKKRILVFNKSDLADNEATKAWAEEFQRQGFLSLTTNCMSGEGTVRLLKRLENLQEEKNRGQARKKPYRLMIVGVPNVGKSSFINKMSKSSKVKVEDRPGVTRGNQWVTIAKGFDLLDTPGVLWPKFEDPAVGEKLAFTGAVKDQIMDTEQLAGRLLELLVRLYPRSLQERYKVQPADMEGKPGYELLEAVGRKRGMLISGGEIDTERAAIMVLDEFRGGKLGKVTLETAE